MNDPFVSFVIPCYNFANYIERCIDSIYKQKLNCDFEVLVRDDGSTDDSGEIIKKLNFPNLIVLDGSKNIGGHENIKLLLNSAKGKYISYLDGDDYLDNENKTQFQLDFLENNPDFVMHLTSFRFVFDNGTYYPEDVNQIMIFNNYTKNIEDLIQENCSGFGRVFRNIKGIYKDYFKNMTFVDWCLNYELSKFGKIKQEDILGGYYRVHENGAYNGLKGEEKFIEGNIVRNIINENYKNFIGKSILIVENYNYNPKNEEIFLKNVNLFCENNVDMILLTDQNLGDDIFNKFNHVLYNKQINNYDFWFGNEFFDIFKINFNKKKLYSYYLKNFFLCLNIIKNFNYKYFYKLNFNNLYGVSAVNFLNDIKNNCLDQEKKGFFYSKNGRISDNFYFSHIDYFLQQINSITSYDEYEKYLAENNLKNYNLNPEEYIYHNLSLKKINNPFIINNDPNYLENNFNNTIWYENLNEEVENFETDILKFFDKENNEIYNKRIIFTKSNSHDKIERKILILKEGEVQNIISHAFENANFWHYNIIENDFDSIRIFDNNIFVKELKNQNIENYIKIKN